MIPTLPPRVRLVAVTKGRGVEEIESLINHGILWFGENRIQEILEKWPSLKEKYPHVKLQFIGRLQSNKAFDAISLCDSIISLDRLSLIDAVTKALLKHPKPMELLIQVSLAKEVQKGGVSSEKLEDLLVYSKNKRLTISGLMTVPPVDSDPRPFFKTLSSLCNEYSLQEKSMGMSTDYTCAIEEGATQVRLGRILFQ